VVSTTAQSIAPSHGIANPVDSARLSLLRFTRRPRILLTDGALSPARLSSPPVVPIACLQPPAILETEDAMSLTPFGAYKRVLPRILLIPWQSVVPDPPSGASRPQESAMLPRSPRLPRRWKVLFWRLSDRLRKPRPAPPFLPEEQPLDLPASLRRPRRH
jgi:hypothetical protein